MPVIVSSFEEPCILKCLIVFALHIIFMIYVNIDVNFLGNATLTFLQTGEIRVSHFGRTSFIPGQQLRYQQRVPQLRQSRALAALQRPLSHGAPREALWEPRA